MPSSSHLTSQAQSDHSKRYGFSTLDSHLLERAGDHLIITPNERLAREHQRTYDNHQQALGHQAWYPLACTSLSRFFRQQYDQLLDQGLAELPILHTDQLICIAQRLAPDDMQDDISTFCDAWSAIHAYDVDLHHHTMQSSHRRLFVRWFRQVHAAVIERYVIEETIPDHLCRRGMLSKQPLLFDHIDQLSAPQQRYFAALAKHFQLWRHHSPACSTFAADLSPVKTDTGVIELRSAANLEDEIAMASAWAAEKLAAQSDAYVGIVVPDLTRHYDMVSRHLGTALQPEQGSLAQVYDISSGTPMSQLPMWRDAQLYLDFCFDQIEFSAANRLVNSKFLAAPALDKLATLVASPGDDVGTKLCATDLADALQISDWQAIDRSTTPLQDWYQRFMDCLQKVQWTTATPIGSVQYQAREQLQQAFESITTAVNAEAGGALSYRQARTVMTRLLQRRLFAPQRTPARVQALGALESTGLAFTHLWVCGADENRMPAPLRPNRFIPPSLASQHGLPRSTPQQELSLTATLIQQWSTNTEQTVFSYSLRNEESDQLPSQLVLALQPVKQSANQTAMQLYPLYRANGTQLETYWDDVGPKLDQPAGQTVTGGTRLIEDQAHCPFRAFASHRLGLKQPRHPSDFPDALIRGNCLHTVLQKLFTQYPDSASLLDVSEADIVGMAQAVLKPYHLPVQFVQHEVARLTQLVLNWLELESQRHNFKAVQIERNYTLNLSAITIHIRIDRVDEVDNKLLIIDYKTGRVTVPASDTLTQRAPQLPLYSLLDDQVAGVYYAQINKDTVQYNGLADPDYAIKPARNGKLNQPWSGLQAQWRADLNQLAQDFANGKASVDPIPRACDYCHLRNVCRINLSR